MDVKERRFYKVITKILTMNKEEAVKYIISESISCQSVYDYIRNYLLYNPDFMTEEVLKETAKFLEEVKKLLLDSINGNTKKERNQKKFESINKYYEDKRKEFNRSVYEKNRYILEEYVDNEEYIYTILNKYRKSYDIFMILVETASTLEGTYDKVLYDQVKKLFESKEKYANQEIENIVPLVLGFIKEGIKIGNKLVPFTIFDYYSNFSIPIEYFFLYSVNPFLKCPIEILLKCHLFSFIL